MMIDDSVPPHLWGLETVRIYCKLEARQFGHEWK